MSLLFIWQNFSALPENKADLARILSEQLITKTPPDREIVVAGGFADELEVHSSQISTDLSDLTATHKQGDTRLVLHHIIDNFSNVVVCARDTDVLPLLMSHHHHFSCQNRWMKSATAKKPK